MTTPTITDTTRARRTTALNAEMQSLDFANYLYWHGGQSYPLTARAEYQKRKERLKEVHSELAQLAISSLN
jgi:hypothetical protein